MKKQQFKHSALPYILVAPQLLIISIFFVWPAFQSLKLSLYLEDPMGLGSIFVGFENYQIIFEDIYYKNSVLFTVIFSTLVTLLSLGIALLLAVKADKVIKAQNTYKILLIWPYAIAPAVAGLMAKFMFDPNIGTIYAFLNQFWNFNYKTDAIDATGVLIVVAVWKQVSVNFVYFLAGLQGIPKTVKEAALMDCASSLKRFWSVIFPLLAPTTFFLLIINITYAFFDTFPLIDVLTQGLPAGRTNSLVYKVYQDGTLGGDLGSSSAQSVVLMVFVMILTVIQFRFIERKVHY